MHKYLLIPIIFLLLFKLQAQETVVDIRLLNKDDGLQGYIVNSIVQDKKGFIWIATNEGLNRYDGNEFKLFSRDQLSIKSPDPLYLYCDQQSNIWISSNNLNILNSSNQKKRERALFILNTTINEVTSFEELFKSQSSLNATDIFAIKQDLDNTIWITTSNGELYRYTSTLKKVFTNNSEARPTLIYPKENNEYWGLYSKTLFRFDQSGKIIGKEKFPLAINEIIPLEGDNFILGYQFSRKLMTRWLSTLDPAWKNQNKIFEVPNLHLKSNAGDTSKYLPEYKINLYEQQFVKIDIKNRIWAINNKGITIYNADNDPPTFISKNQFPSFKKLDFFMLYIDNKGEGWVPFGGGIVHIKLSPRLFKTYLNEEKSSVRSINKLNDTTLFMTSYDGLKICNTNTFDCKNYNELGLFYGHLVVDRDSFLLMGSHGFDLYEISKSTQKVIKTYKKSGFNTLIPYYDRQHNLWMGYQEGLKQYDPARDTFVQFDNYNGFEALQHTLVHHITETKEGMWITTNGGIFLMDQSQQIVAHYNHFPDKNILYLYPENDQTFWLGTANGGLIKWNRDNDQIQQFTKETGLSDDRIYAVIEDKSGYFWLPSNKGLMRFDKKTNGTLIFSEKDGIAHEEFNQHAHYKDGEGNIYLGGLGGITSFHPDHIPIQKNYSVPFVPVELKIHNRNTGLDEDFTAHLMEKASVTLEPHQNTFSIKYSLLNFSKSENLYAYKIEGLDNQWTFTDENNVKFHHLPYGNFTLLIKAKGYLGQWSDQIIEIPLSVKMPFYKKTSAIVLLVALLGLLYFFFARIRISRLNRKKALLEAEIEKRTQQINSDRNLIASQKEKLEVLNEAKDRLFAIIGHELRSPMVYFQGMAKKLNFLIQSKRFDDAISLGDNLDKSAHEINSILDNLLNWGVIQTGRIPFHPQKVLLKDIEESVLVPLQNFAEAKNIQLDYCFTTGEFINADRNAVFIILRNIVTNAIKFTNNGGLISIEHKTADTTEEITITDNGIGIAPELLETFTLESDFSSRPGTDGEKGTGLGLKLSRKLMAVHNGQMHISSLNTGGTKVRLIFPKMPLITSN